MNTNELSKILINKAKSIENYIIQTRQHLHQYPETAYEEKNTTAYIKNALNELNIPTLDIDGTGTIGVLTGSKKGRVIALRADIDALNVQEENDIPYKSKNVGKMHACGHDGHTAMLLGAAHVLSKYKDKISGTIKLIFQPAEEGGAGAKKIIDSGFLDDVEAVFGIHLWQALPSGIIATRAGPAFASSDRFTIVIEGKGGHVASPTQTVDPTSVLIDIYNALQKLVSREVNPFDPCILALPRLKGSDAHNIIPSKAQIHGTLRTMNPDTRERIIKRIGEVVEGYSKAWRCEFSIDFSSLGYPSVINDEELVSNVINILKDLDDVQKMDQTMIGEDFSFYQQKTKGVFMVLGIYNEEKGIIYPHHHPKFQIDEDILWKGAAIYSLLGLLY